jgi:hypothetical protein
LIILFLFLKPSNYIRQNVLNQPADSISEPYKERFGQRILIECQAINFRLHINNEENNDAINQVIIYYKLIKI